MFQYLKDPYRNFHLKCELIFSVMLFRKYDQVKLAKNAYFSIINDI